MPIITPVYIPYNTTPSLCPKCHKDEDIKEVCKHCGYEYQEEKTSGGVIFFCICIICLFLWAIGTIFNWIAFNWNQESLFEIIGNQFKYITSLRVF